MKKLVFVTILFCCMSFIFFGCHNNTNIATSNKSNTVDNSGQFEIIMDDVFNELQPGTAGGSLKAVRALVKLLDYSFDNKIEDNSVNSWIAKIDNSDSMNQEKIESLLSAMNSIDETNFSDLMSEAGVTSSKYPWDKETIDNVYKVLNTIKANIK